MENPIVLFVGGLLILIIVAQASSAYLRSRTFRNQVANLKGESQQYETDIQELESRIAHLKTAEGVELEARDRLNMKKPGENVVVIIDENEKNQSTEGDDTSWWKRVSTWFPWN